MQVEKFMRWFNDAKPGDRIEYYRGHLAHDRLSKLYHERKALDRLAHAVWAHAIHGQVVILQERNGPMDYSYVAQRATKEFQKDFRFKFVQDAMQEKKYMNERLD